MRLPRITKLPDNGFILTGVQTPAAAGTTQATGTQLTATVANVTAADGTRGVVLPSAVKGMSVEVVNTSTAGVLKVYPFAGDNAAINALAADSAFSVGSGRAARFVAESKTQWRTADVSSGNITNGAGTAQIDAEQFTIATSDSATYNNTGLDTAAAAAVFTPAMGGSTNGALTLAAGKTYSFEFQYNLTNTGTTSHTWATLFGGTATFTKFSYSVYGLSYTTANVPATGGLTGFTTAATATVATAASTSATEQVTIQGVGVLVVNAGGTFIPQLQASARPGASGVPGVVVKAGSFFRIWEMAPTAFVGNWS